jgi:hypothetical protein
VLSAEHRHFHGASAAGCFDYQDHLSFSMKSPPAAVPLPDGAATSHDWSSSLAVNSERLTPPPPLPPLRVRWWWCCASGGLLDATAECVDRVRCLLDGGGDTAACGHHWISRNYDHDR